MKPGKKREKFTKSIILKMLKKALLLAEIADLCDTSEAKIREIAKENGIECQP
jgi:hypothetical protein